MIIEHIGRSIIQKLFKKKKMNRLNNYNSKIYYRAKGITNFNRNTRINAYRGKHKSKYSNFFFDLQSIIENSKNDVMIDEGTISDQVRTTLALLRTIIKFRKYEHDLINLSNNTDGGASHRAWISKLERVEQILPKLELLVEYGQNNLTQEETEFILNFANKMDLTDD